jgi:hypothetical protein
MKKLIPLFCSLLLILLSVSACQRDEQQDAQTMIAGENSKVWNTVGATSASGTREQLSRDEINEVMQFYANGTFTVNTLTDHGSGSWFYDAAANTLTLQFGSRDTREVFEVEKLTTKEMRLRAPDQSERTLQAVDRR